VGQAVPAELKTKPSRLTKPLTKEMALQLAQQATKLAGDMSPVLYTCQVVNARAWKPYMLQDETTQYNLQQA
jgi:hypothetical protein